MRATFLGLLSLVLAAPGVALADPDDPAPPAQLTAAQEQPPKAEAAPAPAAAATQAPPPGDARPNGPDLRDCHCGPPETWWINAEYLLWWVKNGPLPVPLVTTGTPDGMGILGEPGTSVVLGNSSFDYGRMSGVQVGGGAWLDGRHVWGLETDGFILQRRSVSAAVASDASGNPLLARPFTDVITPNLPVASSSLIAFPGELTGNFALSSSSRLWGLEANVLRNLCAAPYCKIDLLLGFRYLDLDEDLQLSQQSQTSEQGVLVFRPNLEDLNPPTVTSISIQEGFKTRNQVYAGQIGLRWESHFGSAVLGVTGKVALGPNHETVEIAGTTAATFAGAPSQTAPGGLLALPGTNIGRSNDNPFVIVPQVDVRVGYQLGTHLQIFAGYDFLFINEVVRPGSQINLNVNTAFVPTSPNFGSAIAPNEPSRTAKRDEFWAQGIHFGVEFRY